MSIKISDSLSALSPQLAAFGATPAAGETSLPQAFDGHLEGAPFARAKRRLISDAIIAGLAASVHCAPAAHFCTQAHS
jgi:hypothetical protein